MGIAVVTHFVACLENGMDMVRMTFCDCTWDEKGCGKFLRGEQLEDLRHTDACSIVTKGHDAWILSMGRITGKPQLFGIEVEAECEGLWALPRG